MAKNLFFRSEILKDNTGFLIRVPTELAKELGVKENDHVGISLSIAGNLEVPKAMIEVYRKHMPEIASLSNTQISVLLNLAEREKTNPSQDISPAVLDSKLMDAYKAFKKRLAMVDVAALKKDLDVAATKLMN